MSQAISGTSTKFSNMSDFNLDERDLQILLERKRLFNQHTTPQVGDFVKFVDGVKRRISHNWGDAVQTSDGGSFYLGAGWMSFSGSLYTSIPIDTLTLTDRKEDGSCWFFHHDYSMANNGVYITIPCRVWNCSLVANKV
jgi:hypothetical protein